MWLGDEFEEASLEIATHGWGSPDVAVAAKEVAPALELSDSELSQLAEDEGWDLAEVEAIRSLLGRPSDSAAKTETVGETSAPAEPDEPNGASGTEFVGERSEPRPDPPEDQREDRPEDPPENQLENPPAGTAAAWSYERSDLTGTAEGASSSVDEPPSVDVPTNILGRPYQGAEPMTQPIQRGGAVAPIGDPQWLRGRQGPAATAYRRLRRLFPG